MDRAIYQIVKRFDGRFAVWFKKTMRAPQWQNVRVFNSKDDARRFVYKARQST